MLKNHIVRGVAEGPPAERLFAEATAHHRAAAVFDDRLAAVRAWPPARGTADFLGHDGGNPVDDRPEAKATARE